jgi:hypothetical protein
MRAMRFVALLILVVACGGKAATPPPKLPEPPKPDPIPTTAGPACDAVANHVAELAGAEPDATESRARLTGAIAKRCTEDRWTDVVRSCLATATTDEEGEGCVNQLTKAQREAVERDVAEALEGTPDGEGKKEEGKMGGKRGTTRGGASADPCAGGEDSSDPCAGGE